MKEKSQLLEILGYPYHLAGFMDNKKGDEMENMKSLRNEIVSTDTERYVVRWLRSIAYWPLAWVQSPVIAAIAKAVTSISKSFTLFLSSFSSSRCKAHDERFISPHGHLRDGRFTKCIFYFANCYKEKKKRDFLLTSSEALERSILSNAGLKLWHLE